MAKSTLPDQEGIDSKLIEDISQIEKIGFGEGAATCHVCDEMFREGEPVVAYVVRPMSASSFTVGPIFCHEHESDAEPTWSRGSRELIVQGRVGTVSDAAVQSSWPVLLAPGVRLVSPAGAAEAYTPEESETLRSEAQSRCVECGTGAGNSDTTEAGPGSEQSDDSAAGSSTRSPVDGGLTWTDVARRSGGQQSDPGDQTDADGADLSWGDGA